ncbi:conserved hypothetical protein [Tenacibaculum maritimum]|uniref:hypothetical protein n=1 Tax=Tenacibaculum maritimum TaxID=107401 RepID=UPI0012E42E29|nr:hypothetical protein [Tenacibaculum maritimum]CAA0149639.1 conserved hypothetical protein [Tenacibaculum maritimum]
MILVVWNIIKTQSIKVKALLIIVAFGSILLMSYTIKYALIKRQLVKEYKNQIENLELELVASNKREQASVDKNKRLTKAVRKAELNIDKKLQQDEKIIDNDAITDDDIRSFISKHQKR